MQKFPAGNQNSSNNSSDRVPAAPTEQQKVWKKRIVWDCWTIVSAELVGTALWGLQRLLEIPGMMENWLERSSSVWEWPARTSRSDGGEEASRRSGGNPSCSPARAAAQPWGCGINNSQLALPPWLCDQRCCCEIFPASTSSSLQQLLRLVGK